MPTMRETIDKHGATAVFMAIADFAKAIGVGSIKDLPGCWEVELPSGWWFAVNGHAEPVKGSHGPDVPPFHAYIERDGWPAGLVSPADGLMVGGTEAEFLAVIKAATQPREAAP